MYISLSRENKWERNEERRAGREFERERMRREEGREGGMKKVG